MDLWIEAKIIIADWIGVIEVTKLADQILPSSENINIRAKAYSELAESAREAGDYSNALSYFHTGGKMVDEAFAKGWARGRVAELNEMRLMFFQSYVRMNNWVTQDVNEYIEIWLTILEAFDSYVRSPSLLQLGIERLESWWHVVQQRERYDEKAAKLMKVQLHKLDKVINILNHRTYPDNFYYKCSITKESIWIVREGYINEYIHSETVLACV